MQFSLSRVKPGIRCAITETTACFPGLPAVAEESEMLPGTTGPANEALDKEEAAPEKTEITQEGQPEQLSLSNKVHPPVTTLTGAPTQVSSLPTVPPPVMDDDNSKTDVEKTDTEQEPGELVSSGSRLPIAGFPPFRVLTPQLAEESQETNSQQDEVLSQESFNLDGDGGVETPMVHFLTHSTRNPVRWPKV